jgi:hypothetical protein
MGSRSRVSWSSACVLALAVGVVTLCTAAPAVAAAPPPGAWSRPVSGAVAHPFVEPTSRYGAGHRGVDFVAPSGTPVRAANAGQVTFAGSVAGSLHVVVAHTGGLRTSSSFLATIAVRRGQSVARGDVLGTAGGGSGDHAGVVHFGLRVGERYLDPMALFVPADLTKLIRLAPADGPDQRGFEPPEVESRSLAESLHLSQGVEAIIAPGDAGGPLDGVGAAFADMAGIAGDLNASLGGPAQLLGGAAGWLWGRSVLAKPVADVRTMGTRLLAWARSRDNCTDDTRQPASGGGSGHSVMTVAGINSSTGKNGVALQLDAERVGYRDGEVTSFSYAPDGGPYTKEDTWGELRGKAVALGDQLRAMQRKNPGREVDLIAHSQGGVVVAEFLANVYEPEDPTLPPLGSVVTLSSPLQGAPAATASGRIRESASGRAALDGVDQVAGGAVPPSGGMSTVELAEGSQFMRRLRRAEIPGQIDLTSISATDDFIVPADHTTRPGARTITVNPPGPMDHSAIYGDPGALDATRLALELRPLPCVGTADGVRGAVEPVVISRIEHEVGEKAGTLGDSVDFLLGRGDAP